MEVKPEIETPAKIKVIGVGGGGGSAINRMVQAQIRGVEFLAANTDEQALVSSLAPVKIHIGKTVTKGLGAGMDPEKGRKAAEESQNDIRDALNGANMVFITCGLGGGTGTGAGPVVAQLAKDIGALTIAIVTKPFSFELSARKSIADKGWDELESKVDAIITIPNDKILQIIDRNTPAVDAFELADEILQQGVRGISEIITVTGLINVDFADVERIMRKSGSAIMGIGKGTGDNRAVEAAKKAIASPLLDLSMEGAKGVLFTVSGGPGLSMFEYQEAAKIITSSVDPDAEVIAGMNIDPELGDELRVTVIATRFSEQDRVVSKAAASSFEKGYERPLAAYPLNQGLFNPPAPRTVTVKQSKDAERPQKSESPMIAPAAANQEDAMDDIDIPTFLKKKML